MYNQLHFSKIIEGLVNGLDIKPGNILFVKQYNDNADIEKSFISHFSKIPNLEILYYQFNNIEIQDAYAPFLEWIKELYDKYYKDSLSVEEFVDKCDIYKMHKEIFISYLKTGIAKRNSELVISEINYETRRMLRGIISIFEFVSKKVKLVFVLNRFHYANISTVDLLLEYMNFYEFRRTALLCVYDDSCRKSPDILELWKQLNIIIEDNNYLMSWDDRTLRDSVAIKGKEFNPKVSMVDEYIVKLNNMVAFLANKQVVRYIDIFNKKVNMEHLNIDREKLVDMTFIGMYANICCGKCNEAIHMATDIIDRYNFRANLVKFFRYNYLLTLAYVYVAKSNEARKYANECMDIAKKLNDEQYLLDAYIAGCYVDFYGWKYVLGDIETDFPMDIVRIFEKKGMLNLAGVIYAYAYKCDEDFDIEKAKINLGTPKFIERAIEIAKILDNENLLSIAYMNKANVCASVNNFDYVDGIYRECIRIYKKYNQNVLMAQTYISVGYNLLMVEQYVHSNEYFNAAVEILYKEKDVERIGETLYNMGINSILALDYENALEFLLASLKICQILELNGYAVCKLTKIYGLIAICSYYLNKNYMLTYCVDKVEKMLDVFIKNESVDTTYWEEDLFLYYFAKGLLQIKEDKLDEAIASINKSKVYADKCLYFIYFTCPLYSMVLASIYYRKNMNEVADSIIDEAIIIMDKYNLVFKKRMLLGMKSGIMYSKKERLGLINLSMDSIIDMAYYKREVNQYFSENRDINFLFSWQNILNQFDKSTFDLFEKSIMTIKNSFFLDGIYCFSIENGFVDIVFSNADIKFKNEELDCINDIINEGIPAFMINKNDGVLPQQRRIIDILESNSFMTILGVPYKTLNNVNYYLLGYAYTNSTFASNKIRVNSKVLQVVKIVFGQFIDAVWRIESDEEIKSANNKLKDMATRDMLTGLYNRQGYVSNIKELCAKDYNRSIIMYFDLDNFKYYNDNFGHDMGDMILVEFAKILLNCEVGDDFAVRYGGDEFLLILCDKDIDYSKMIAERIYKKLKHDMNYQIENKAGRILDIDENLKLTCSIGIAPINFSSINGVNEAMKCADKALYSVKNSGKGQYKIYSE